MPCCNSPFCRRKPFSAAANGSDLRGAAAGQVPSTSAALQHSERPQHAADSDVSGDAGEARHGTARC
jgi:hypothetical protein